MLELDVSTMRREIAELIKQLRRLSKTEAKKVLRKACRASCKVMLPTARALAPVESGDLRRAIKVKALPRSRRYVGARVSLQDIRNTEQFYGSFVELGYKTKSGKKVHGQNFLARAFEQTVRQANHEAVRVARIEFAKALRK